jgi:hypothetical protein
MTALLLAALRRRCFPGLPWWVLVPGILAAGLANPLPLLLARAAVYEAAILLAQLFLLSGLYAAFTGLCGERCVRWRLAGAGAAWALAVCTRISLLPAVGVLALLVAWRLYELRPGGGRSRAGFAVALSLFAAPLAAAGVALGAYNYVRFGSWHDFGMRYQLAGYNVHALAQSGVGVLSGRFLAANLYAYVLHPFAATRHFPFVKIPRVVLGGVPIPEDPVAGVIWTLPYLWLAAVPALPLAARLLLNRRSTTESTAGRTPRRWFSLCLLSAGLCGIAPALLVDGCQNRYLADAVPSLLVLATLGAWEGLARQGPGSGARRAFLGLLAGCTLATVLLGVLLGAYWQEYSKHPHPRIGRAARLELARGHPAVFPGPARNEP